MPEEGHAADRKRAPGQAIQGGEAVQLGDDGIRLDDAEALEADERTTRPHGAKA